MVNITKKQKSFITLVFLLILPISFLVIYVVAQDEVTIIDGDDIIKNFRFAQYRDNEPTRPIYEDQSFIDGGKLKIQYGSWNIKNFNILDIAEGQTTTKLTYLLNLTNVIYVYTNVPINGLTSTAGDWQRTSYYSVARINYRSWYLDAIVGIDYFMMSHTYYDFGDLQSWNSINNKHIWDGDMKFDFDISNTPFLGTVTGEDGVNYDPTFSYLSIYDVKVTDIERGSITDADVQDLINNPSGNDESPDLRITGGPSSGSKTLPVGDTLSGGVWSWDARPYFYDPVPSGNFFDGGHVLPGINSPLTVERKDGSPAWQGNNVSMEDGVFTLPIGRISPTAVEHQRTLRYQYVTLDSYRCGLLGLGYCYASNSPDGVTNYIAKPSSLHIDNRYTKFEVSMELLVTTDYNLDVYRQVDEVGKPIEYYDNLIFSSSVGGSIEGDIALVPDLGGAILSWILIIIIIIGIIIVLYVAAKSYGKRKKQIQQIYIGKSTTKK